MGIDWFLKLMFASCSFVLKVSEFSLDLLGQLVIAHFHMPKSIPGHAQY